MKRFRPKARLRQLKLSELSLVDSPANPEARVTLFKRADTAGDSSLSESIAKRYLDPSEGARSFGEVLQSEMEEAHYWRVQREVGPAIGALETAMRSIAGDGGLDSDNKQAMMRNSVEDFLASIRQRWPDVEMALAKAYQESDEDPNKGDVDMNELEKLQSQVKELTEKLAKVTAASEDAGKVAQAQEELKAAQKQSEELSEKLAAVEAEKAEAEALGKLSDEEKEYAKSLEADARKEFLALSDDKRRQRMRDLNKNDEVITVEGRAIRKSVVGEDQFAVFKSLQDRFEKQETDRAAERAELVKEREQRETAVLTKRVDDDFKHLPGEILEKVEAFRAIAKMEEGARKALERMLSAGEKAISAGFESLGHHREALTKTAEDFQKRVDEIREKEDCSHTKALQRARKRFPEEFEAYQSAGSTN
jgi:hypothetical protein